MRSDVADAATPADVSDVVRELLVLWQHPDTREIMPIGRLTHDDAGYSYSYTRAAAEVDGFRLLPGLGQFGDRVHSSMMPAIFRLRVMDRDRPDYGNYIAALGLEPNSATPWEQIVHSGGERAGDTLQFMEVPKVENGRARARFLANGVRHIPGHRMTVAGNQVVVTQEEHEAALAELRPGAPVELVAEENNPHDTCATLVTGSGTPVGWVPKVLSGSIRELLDLGPIKARVVRVNGPGSPAHLRLVLDLDTPAPPGFAFDREERWERISR